MGPIILTQLATGLSVLAGAALIKSVIDQNPMMGSGPGSGSRCVKCNGTGRVSCLCNRWSDGDSGCRTCAGSGRMACNSCGGSGTGRPLPVRISVRPPNHITEGTAFYATFQYERLPLFCFVCGVLGHGEKFCPVKFHNPNIKEPYGWNSSLRCTNRRNDMPRSSWLRNSDGSVLNSHGSSDGSSSDNFQITSMNCEDDPLSKPDGKKRQRNNSTMYPSVSVNTDSMGAYRSTHNHSSNILAGAVVRPDQEQ